MNAQKKGLFGNCRENEAGFNTPPNVFNDLAGQARGFCSRFHGNSQRAKKENKMITHIASAAVAAEFAERESRGHLRLTGPNPLDPIQIESNYLSHPDDLKAAIACVELCREIGNSAALRPFTKREVMPGNLRGAELENFVRDAVMSYWHE